MLKENTYSIKPAHIFSEEQSNLFKKGTKGNLKICPYNQLPFKDRFKLYALFIK